MKVRCRVPDAVLGRSLPERFRTWRILFVPPACLISDLADWFEAEFGGVKVETPVTKPGDSEPSKERDALIEGCMELCDYLDSNPLREMLLRTLSRAGVYEIVCEGEVFDASRHHAVDWLPATNPALHLHVAKTEQPGYRDRDRVIRFPDVLVYRLEGQQGGN